MRGDRTQTNCVLQNPIPPQLYFKFFHKFFSENKLLVRLISYVRHELYNKNIFSKDAVTHIHLKCCYFWVSLLPPDIVAAAQLPSNLIDYQLHKTISEGHILFM